MPRTATLAPSGVCICGDKNCGIPYGLCHCGCGAKAPIAKSSSPKRKLFKGFPARYACHRRATIHPVIEEAVPFKIDGVYCRLIPLSKGLYAIVNEVDYYWLMQWKWCVMWNINTRSYYAYRRGPREGGKQGKTIYMHRVILGLSYGDLNESDHRDNWNTLDNRRNNLRVTDDSGNAKNKRKRKDNTSGFKGVSYIPRRKKWGASIMVEGRTRHLGLFDTKGKAYAAYCKAALELHGEFARLE
jgi:hypothetical protein